MDEQDRYENGLKVRRAVLERLELADQPPELLALLEVVGGQVGRARGDADQLRG